jgi:D-tyrosyl-tRNA(Tyr) deacylase
MRAVVQRVSHARVTIAGEDVGAIARGLLVYLGVGKGDGASERRWMLDKITGLRIFPNDEGKMDKSVLDIGGALLVVSQFTLYGDVTRGRRPSFDGAMPPADAEAAYEAFVREARERLRVETGRFGADMRVSSENEGPVTIWLDTAKPEGHIRPS